MKERLEELLNNSYVPISNFPVSCVLVTKDNKGYVGVNVEDASTRAGTCAERAAIFNAISNGCKKDNFKEINIMTKGEKISTPCFVCRQMLNEMFDRDAIVRCFNVNGESKEYTVEELCPHPFGEDDLK